MLPSSPFRSLVDMRDIHTLSEFQQNAEKFAKEMNETGGPLILTVKGKPALVVQDAETYQELLDKLDEAEDLAAVMEGQLDFAEGRYMSWEQCDTELRKEFGLPPRSVGKGKKRAPKSARVDAIQLSPQRRRRVV